MPLEIDRQIVEQISKKRIYQKQFFDLTTEFDSKLIAFNPIENCFSVSTYFSKGKAAAKKALIVDGLIKNEWLRDYSTKNGKIKNDFQGLYIFLNDNTPFYVGISKVVIGRIDQHLKGRSHHTSTLAYNIGLVRYELISRTKYEGTRKTFDFATEVEPAKEFLWKQKVAWLPIKNPEELYLFEIFCSMKLQCWLNRFETH